MPPKKNPNLNMKTTTINKRNSKLKNKTGSIKKQRSSIASRLLEISLKVDDYVYKSIPMSTKNAALFLKEVSGYKDKCVGDKRSLQVIEKLERCMKGIIAEQQELQNHSTTTNISWKDNSSSDTSNLTDNIDKPTINAVYNKDVENDLSWIENIRYVREISAEEKIPMYYEDSFWENYTLPPDWNEDEMFADKI